MINDSALSERLNLFREGELDESSENLIDQMDIDDPNISNLVTILFKIIELGIVFIRSLAYGFAVKTVFVADWKFIAFLAVGFSIDLTVTNIISIINKEDK